MKFEPIERKYTLIDESGNISTHPANSIKNAMIAGGMPASHIAKLTIVDKNETTVYCEVNHEI